MKEMDRIEMLERLDDGECHIELAIEKWSRIKDFRDFSLDMSVRELNKYISDYMGDETCPLCEAHNSSEDKEDGVNSEDCKNCELYYHVPKYGMLRCYDDQHVYQKMMRKLRAGQWGFAEAEKKHMIQKMRDEL